MKDWLVAIRLRTLPLALACTGMGSILAYHHGQFRGEVALLTLLTATLLQILSNLANDYGDFQHGVDSDKRTGPQRMVQAGKITASAMKKAIILFSVLSFVSGILLLMVSFGVNWKPFLVFVGIGIASIVAAIAYTNGKRPYGYVGLGDISVLIFFGLVAVLGSAYLHHLTVYWVDVLPAISCGLFATAVLNINNIRDVESDQASGKYSLPVRLGRKNAKLYHWVLLGLGAGSTFCFALIEFRAYSHYLFLLSFLLLIKNGRGVGRGNTSAEIDPYLKQMALSTLAFVVLFGIGVALN